MGSAEELQEAAEKVREPFDRIVGATMAIVAAALALVSVMGQMTITEELLSQQKASDQWSYYQSKSIRRYQSEFAGDILRTLPGAAAVGAAKKYESNTDRYRKDTEEIQTKARELEKESEVKGRQGLRLHVGEIFLEFAIVLSSLSLLTHLRSFWAASIVAAVTGSALAVTALLVH